MHGMGKSISPKEKVLLSPEDGQELLVKQKPSDVLHMWQGRYEPCWKEAETNKIWLISALIYFKYLASLVII